jgi:hypothetical protein
LGEGAKFEFKNEEETKIPTKPGAVRTGIPLVLMNATKSRWCIQSATISVRDLDKEDEEELVRALTKTDCLRG